MDAKPLGSILQSSFWVLFYVLLQSDQVYLSLPSLDFCRPQVFSVQPAINRCTTDFVHLCSCSGAAPFLDIPYDSLSQV